MSGSDVLDLGVLAALNGVFPLDLLLSCISIRLCLVLQVSAGEKTCRQTCIESALITVRMTVCNLGGAT